MITSPISPPEGPLVVFETPIATPCLIAPRNTWCGNACFWERVSAKYGTWMIGSFCNLCAVALGVLRWRLHIFGKQSWWVPKRTKQLSTRTTSPVAILLYQFLSCWCGDGERCVTFARAAAKETRNELEIVWRLRLRHRNQLTANRAQGPAVQVYLKMDASGSQIPVVDFSVMGLENADFFF